MTEQDKKAIEILESSNKILEDKLKILKKENKELKEQLALYGVVPSYYQVVQETRKLGLQEVTSGLKTLEQAKKAMKENEQWFDKMYIMARIDN